MYVAGGIILICYLALGILSRGETEEEDVSRILIPFYKMAVYVYKKICIRKWPLFSSVQVERDLSVLHPGEGKEHLKAHYYIKKISFSLAILLVGTLFGVFAKYNVQSNMILDKEGRVIRGNYKEGSVKVRLEAEYGDRKNGSFQIEVAPLQLTDVEAEILWEEFWDRLPEYILGENKSIDRISYDLILEERYGDYPFLLEWESRSPAVVGSTGRVYPAEQPIEVEMAVKMIYGGRAWEEILCLKVVPEELSDEKRFQEELEDFLIQSEYENRREEAWELPREWRGQAVNWQLDAEDYSVVLWMLAIVTAISVYRMSDYDLHRQLEQRKKQMWKDYPDIVHKLALYIGAGMTIRGAFQKVAGEYGRQGKGEEFHCVHPVYEEMLYACREMHSGISEAAAYEHFGKRTGLQEYIRLSTLLIQNLKKGNRTLLERLREEADKAGMERLQSCKRLGEEAGTKLLVPMVLMLAVVMVMIMAPAFSAM